jgi:hypothetical protein
VTGTMVLRSSLHVEGSRNQVRKIGVKRGDARRRLVVA